MTLSADSVYSGSSNYHPVALNISTSRGSPINLSPTKVMPVHDAIASKISVEFDFLVSSSSHHFSVLFSNLGDLSISQN
jgi:queuine/archaeosine tRNA-ribosyltransferase